MQIQPVTEMCVGEHCYKGFTDSKQALGDSQIKFKCVEADVRGEGGEGTDIFVHMPRQR